MLTSSLFWRDRLWTTVPIVSKALERNPGPQDGGWAQQSAVSTTTVSSLHAKCHHCDLWTLTESRSTVLPLVSVSTEGQKRSKRVESCRGLHRGLLVPELKPTTVFSLQTVLHNWIFGIFSCWCSFLHRKEVVWSKPATGTSQERETFNRKQTWKRNWGQEVTPLHFALRNNGA